MLKDLPKIVRLAGYLARLAAVDECGARLRVKYQGESTDYDEKWTPEEEAEYDKLCDEVEPWFYALSKEEEKLVKPIEVFMGCLCRGEDPEEHVKLNFEIYEK